jgi:hypothetical protein
MAGRYGKGVYIRNLSVYSPHSATTLGGVHTFRHIEKKHSNETRERTNFFFFNYLLELSGAPTMF